MTSFTLDMRTTILSTIKRPFQYATIYYDYYSIIILYNLRYEVCIRYTSTCKELVLLLFRNKTNREREFEFSAKRISIRRSFQLRIYTYHMVLHIHTFITQAFSKMQSLRSSTAAFPFPLCTISPSRSTRNVGDERTSIASAQSLLGIVNAN